MAEIEFPGFCDLQVNGFAGVDFNDPRCTLERLQHATESLRTTGVTRFLPTLITSSLSSFSRCARNFAELPTSAAIGIHMEGPYISPLDGPRGAHPREHVIEASIDDFKRRQEAACGHIVLVTVAPEVRGAIRLIECLASQNVRVGLGHTGASPQQIQDAISAGATLATHLGNGCAEMLPRHPNVIWEQLAADELLATFIVDGHHLPATTLKSMVRAKSPARSILVSDATAAAGSAPGFYTLGEAHFELSASGRASVPGTPYMAGSALILPEAVANTVRFTGLSIDQVLPMATSQPAQYLGRKPAGRVLADWDEQKFHLSVKKVIDDTQ